MGNLPDDVDKPMLSGGLAAESYRADEAQWEASLRNQLGGRRGSVAVIGGGIMGLSIARAAARLGLAVELLYDQPILESTSAIAAGLIEPVAPPASHEAQGLLLDAFDVSFKAWAAFQQQQTRPIVATREVTGYRRVPAERPVWADIVGDYRQLRAEEIPASLDEFKWAERFSTFVVDPKPYLSWLVGDLVGAGVCFSKHHVDAIQVAARHHDAIFNATGIGAAALVGDAALSRGDGHVATVPRPAGFVDVVFDWDFGEAHPALGLEFVYVISRETDVVLGGTLRRAPASAGEPAREAGMAERLLAAASALVPAITGPILSYDAASRPLRHVIRIESDTASAGVPVVHCYGTGGSGWTLAPGLARKAIESLSGVSC